MCICNPLIPTFTSKIALKIKPELHFPLNMQCLSMPLFALDPITKQSRNQVEVARNVAPAKVSHRFRSEFQVGSFPD